LDDPGARLVAVRGFTAGGTRFEPGDIVAPAAVSRSHDALVDRGFIRREIVTDPDLPPAA
jgi:hypothetical protein